jgi:aspartate oxidase
VTTNYEVREHDVLIIGAGGAGLRAAIEALAQGASVGVVCKSLLGKAHTVMAEGGIAAAMANVDPADNWKVHFRDTMRGGTTGAWRNCTRWKLRIASANWSNGERFLIAQKMARFCSAPLAATLLSVYAMWAIAPASN